MILGQYGHGFKQTQRIYSIDDVGPTVWACCSHDPYKIAVPKSEIKDGLVQVAMLDKVSFPRLDVCRRVYSPDGIAPTIHTCGSRRSGGAKMKLINATSLGWQEAEDGDGIVLNFLGRARGRVQPGRSPTLHTDGGGSTGVATMTNDNFRIRKLTERECMRLQGFTTEEADILINATDDKGRRKYPKTQIYKFAGNAVCVDCFKRITEQILDDMVEPRKPNNLDRWLA